MRTCVFLLVLAIAATLGLPQPSLLGGASGSDSQDGGVSSRSLATSNLKSHSSDESEDREHTREESLSQKNSQKSGGILGGKEIESETVKETTDTDSSDVKKQSVDTEVATRHEKAYDESADGNKIRAQESQDKTSTTRIKSEEEQRKSVTKTTEIDREKNKQALALAGLVSVDEKHKQHIKKVKQTKKLKKSSNDTTIVEKSHAEKGSTLNCDDDGSCDASHSAGEDNSKTVDSVGSDDYYYDESEDVSEQNTDQTSINAAGIAVPLTSFTSDGTKKEKPGLLGGLPTAGLTSKLGLGL